MKNKVIQKLIDELKVEISGLPSSASRKDALSHLDFCQYFVQAADADSKHNPPGKVVVRNAKGRVVGLQG